NYPRASDERFTKVNVQLDSFIQGSEADKLETRSWGTFEWLHFIRSLSDSISIEQMKDLDAVYTFTKSPNSEIKAAWYKLAINQGYGKEILPDIRDFLVNVGRRKFLTPLYTALIENGMVAEAKSIYAEAKPNYHSVATNTIDALLANAK
ncbi:MAG: leukotriene A4 hydrolase C-terminal domain-containing protein, partial [Bacteroidota bacterium]|nr:leukotriene A4 hydrolase C-terminal domain-containing protein [Bacteroidota bacterium]